MALFRDRHHAGVLLGKKLQRYADRQDVLVLGLARGGVPVAYEVANALKAPLDVFVVRKLGVPENEELALGAIASGGIRVLNEDIVQFLHLTEATIEKISRAEREELQKGEQLYRGDRPGPDVRNKVVILIDDGLATGATMRAAVQALRQLAPKEIVVAVPVAAASTCEEFSGEVDEIVCAATPEPFQGVGLWYDDFSQTSDEEVRDCLIQAAQERNR